MPRDDSTAKIAAGIEAGQRRRGGHRHRIDDAHGRGEPGAAPTEPVRRSARSHRICISLADWFTDVRVTGRDGIHRRLLDSGLRDCWSSAGLRCILVNARTPRTCPGARPTSAMPQWLRQLHSYGLLRGSFRPTREIVDPRAYLRQRERLVEYAAAAHPAYAEGSDGDEPATPSCRLDITGATGMRIIRAIVAGERDPAALALLRDLRCHAGPRRSNRR